MNKEKLRSIIVLNGENQNVLSLFMGITPQSFSGKINERNGAEFTQSEIKLIKDRYNLTAEEVDEIFFSHFVS
ncbi:hypothetical protein [Enterococcus hirae]|uniref:XRE family transcriptional regulator n=2 Tax=Enterococcus hirae TaxID=1354 RepID=I6SAE0_ENTHA|nr:hypothetical protein [Enterococcus hirae]AFM69533.1 hypothetical protein EHR_02785 [Enterococcus hirae ATCC 9790]EMF0378211.1 XRE family transcriptional regulator [Enterococcus hirae]EMF0513168.1 XRE family transcriptional regulator [Enterococcus hirae]EOH67574.1 hypothetical protein UAE_02639 [Enterococcus hirae ATCC 9790]EOU06046.1 hypothetical protein I584_01949 [Enterococcus hirae ATCC 9790]